MSRVRKSAIVFLSIAAGLALAQKDKEKDKAVFTPGPISSFEYKQTIQGVTIAGRAYETREEAKRIFGKVDPNQYGVLPVLVMIENGGKQPLRLEKMKVEYMLPDQRKLERIPPEEVPYVLGPERPKMSPRPIPIPRMPSMKRNKLDIWHIEGRAWAAKMLLPGETAHGFFYYQSRHRLGSQLYVTGIKEAATGNDLFYFEVPLTAVKP